MGFRGIVLSVPLAVIIGLFIDEEQKEPLQSDELQNKEIKKENKSEIN